VSQAVLPVAKNVAIGNLAENLWEPSSIPVTRRTGGKSPTTRIPEQKPNTFRVEHDIVVTSHYVDKSKSYATPIALHRTGRALQCSLRCIGNRLKDGLADAAAHIDSIARFRLVRPRVDCCVKATRDATRHCAMHVRPNVSHWLKAQDGT
jgi:hypothetical protein